MNTKPIIVIEDDPDDSDIIVSALVSLGVKNEIKCFFNGKEALQYLRTSDVPTFLILSDINMPVMSGLELKKTINNDEELRRKSIPFIFLSTATTPQDVEAAYEMRVQGFFEKPSDFTAVKQCLKNMVNYWSACIHPASPALAT